MTDPTHDESDERTRRSKQEAAMLLREQGLMSAADQLLGDTPRPSDDAAPAPVDAPLDEDAAHRQQAAIGALLAGTASRLQRDAEATERSMPHPQDFDDGAGDLGASAASPPPMSRPDAVAGKGKTTGSTAAPSPPRPKAPSTADFIAALDQLHQPVPPTPAKTSARRIAAVAGTSLVLFVGAWIVTAYVTPVAPPADPAPVVPKPKPAEPAPSQKLRDTASMLLDRAERTLDAGDIAAAERLVEEASRLAAADAETRVGELRLKIHEARQEAEAREAKQEARIEAMLVEARRRYEIADFDNAEFLLSAVLARRTGHAEAVQLLERVREIRRAREQERQAQIRRGSQAVPAATSEQPSSISSYTDDNGNDETWWRQRKDQLVAEIAQLQLAIEAAERIVDYPMDDGSGPTGAERTTDAVTLKAQLQRKQAELDGLAVEARRAGALPGWLR